MPLNVPTEIRISHDVSTANATETFATASLTGTGSNSTVFETSFYKDHTLYLKNTANRALTVQVQGSRDQAFTNPFSVGPAISMADGSATATEAVASLTDHVPFIRVNAKSTTTTATSGSLVVELMAQKE